jgi:hypothetical protein
VTSLINGSTYNGAANNTIVMARSSRGPSGSELTSATFWGFAQDGIQIVVFNNRGAIATGADPVSNAKMSPQELHDIYTCQTNRDRWSEIPSLGITPGSPQDGPIVPWSMNSASGTFASFRDYIRNATGDATFDPNAGACVRKLQNPPFNPNTPPFENDIKPLITDPTSLSTDPNSTDNPENFLWWSSFGELSAFPYKSAIARDPDGGGPSGPITFAAASAPVLGFLPSSSNVANNTYPIARTVYHVTKNVDADCPGGVSPCNLTGGPALPGGGNDLAVDGGTSGISGGVREFTRWLCRASATQQTVDPYTGTNYNSGITQAINKVGFTTVPSALRSTGSRCRVLT